MRANQKHAIWAVTSTVVSVVSAFHVAGAPFRPSTTRARSMSATVNGAAAADVIKAGDKAATTDVPIAPVYEARSASAFDHYQTDYQRSIADPASFWAEKATALLDWEKPFASVLTGSLRNGDVTWFAGGKLNVCWNAVDRHVVAGKGDQTALLWEGDEPDDVQSITYAQLQAKVSQIANALKAQGVKKGDVVTLYSKSVVFCIELDVISSLNDLSHFGQCPWSPNFP